MKENTITAIIIVCTVLIKILALYLVWIYLISSTFKIDNMIFWESLMVVIMVSLICRR